MKAAYAKYPGGDLMVVMSQEWDTAGNLTNLSREGHSACSKDYVAECSEPTAAEKRGLDGMLAGADYAADELEFVPLADFKREFCRRGRRCKKKEGE